MRDARLLFYYLHPVVRRADITADNPDAFAYV